MEQAPRVVGITAMDVAIQIAEDPFFERRFVPHLAERGWRFERLPEKGVLSVEARIKPDDQGGVDLLGHLGRVCGFADGSPSVLTVRGIDAEVETTPGSAPVTVYVRPPDGISSDWRPRGMTSLSGTLGLLQRRALNAIPADVLRQAVEMAAQDSVLRSPVPADERRRQALEDALCEIARLLDAGLLDGAEELEALRDAAGRLRAEGGLPDVPKISIPV